MKDIKDSLVGAIRTGKIIIGSKETKNALLTGNLKLIILSKNCPEDIKGDMVYYSLLSKIPYKIVNENTKELGSICGKPFPVSVIGIVDVGDSDILDNKSRKG